MKSLPPQTAARLRTLCWRCLAVLLIAVVLLAGLVWRSSSISIRRRYQQTMNWLNSSMVPSERRKQKASRIGYGKYCRKCFPSICQAQAVMRRWAWFGKRVRKCRSVSRNDRSVTNAWVSIARHVIRFVSLSHARWWFHCDRSCARRSAVRMDVQGYLQFLSACAYDPRFNADNILAAIAYNHKMSALDKAIYRYALIRGPRRLCNSKPKKRVGNKRDRRGELDELTLSIQSSLACSRWIPRRIPLLATPT